MPSRICKTFPITLSLLAVISLLWLVIPNPYGLALSKDSSFLTWFLCHFIHKDLSHLILDSLSVVVISIPLEALLKRQTYLALLLVALPLLSYFHLAVDPESAVMGISGVQHVMTGAVISALVLKRQFALAFLLAALEVLTVGAALQNAGSFAWLSQQFNLSGPQSSGNIAHHLHIAGCLFGFAFVSLISTVPKLIKKESL